MNVQQGFMVEHGTDISDSFVFAAERGFDFLELNMDSQFERTRTNPERVRSLADKYDLNLVVHLPYRLDPGPHHEHVRDGVCRELDKSVDAALEMGADRGVMHATSMAHPGKWTGAEIRPLIYQSIRRVDEYARNRGFRLVVENVKGPFFDVGDFPELFAETDAEACLGTGHAMVSGYDLAKQGDLLTEHSNRIAHIHLNTRRGETGEDEHLPVGMGGRTFDKLTAAMREVDWSGTCTHEVFGYNREHVAVGKRRFDEWLIDT